MSRCARFSRCGLAGAVILGWVWAGAAHGQEADPSRKRLESSPRHHEWVKIKTPAGRTVRAFLVFPEVKKPVPGVVVIHENRGLTDWVRSVADQLAEAGYVALAPDLLSGMGPGGGGTESYASSDAARDGIYDLPERQVMEDLDACVRHVRELEATSDVVAVAGFCWGGGKAFAFAAHNPDIAASFVFYGSAPEAEVLEKIRVPVYGFYGENDFRITGQVPKVQETMKKLGKRFEAVTYEDAGHGFMRSGETAEAGSANHKAMKAAWERWKKILEGLGAARTRAS